MQSGVATVCGNIGTTAALLVVMVVVVVARLQRALWKGAAMLSPSSSPCTSPAPSGSTMLRMGNTVLLAAVLSPLSSERGGIGAECSGYQVGGSAGATACGNG